MKNTDNTINSQDEFESLNASGFLDTTNEEKQKTMQDLGKHQVQPQLFNFDDLLNVPDLPRIKPSFGQRMAGEINQLKVSIKVMDLYSLFASGGTTCSFTASRLKTPTIHGATHKLEAAQLFGEASEERVEGTKVLLSEVHGHLDDFTFHVSTKQMQKYARKNFRGEVRLYLIAVEANRTVKIYWAGN